MCLFFMNSSRIRFIIADDIMLEKKVTAMPPPVRVTAGLKLRAPLVNHMLFFSTKPYAEFSLKRQHQTGITEEAH